MMDFDAESNRVVVLLLVWRESTFIVIFFLLCVCVLNNIKPIEQANNKHIYTHTHTMLPKTWSFVKRNRTKIAAGGITAALLGGLYYYFHQSKKGAEDEQMKEFFVER